MCNYNSPSKHCQILEDFDYPIYLHANNDILFNNAPQKLVIVIFFELRVDTVGTICRSNQEY